MPFCRSCGAEQGPGAGYCTSCGALISSPPAGKPLPPVTPPTSPKLSVPAERASVAVPAWITADWPAVAVCAGLILLVLIAGCGLYGLVLTVVSTGNPGAALDGIVVGLYLVFAAVGATVRLAVLGGAGDATYSVAYVPLGLSLGAAGAVWYALRATVERRRMPVVSAPALAAKVVVVTSSVLTILASVLSLTDPDGSVVAEVDPRRTLVGAVLVVGLTALAFSAHRRSWAFPPWVVRNGLDRVVRALVTGAASFLALAVAAGVFTLVGALLTADSGGDRLRLVAGIPLVGINLVLVSGVAALGATVGFGVAEVSDVFGAGFGGSATATLSLFRFGFPPAASTGSAPFLLLVVYLLLGPALLAGAIARRMRDEPAEASVIGTWVLLAGLGFVGAACLAGLMGQIKLFADAKDVAGGSNFVVVRPDLVTTLGYSALWAILGAIGGWWTWFVRRAPDAVEGPPAADPAPADVLVVT